MPVADLEKPGVLALALDPPGLPKGLALRAALIAAEGVLTGWCGHRIHRTGRRTLQGRRCGNPSLPGRPGTADWTPGSPAVVFEPGSQVMGHLQLRPRGRHCYRWGRPIEREAPDSALRGTLDTQPGMPGKSVLPLDAVSVRERGLRNHRGVERPSTAALLFMLFSGRTNGSVPQDAQFFGYD